MAIRTEPFPGGSVTTDQRNAVIRLIQAAETVVQDYERGNLTHTRHAVQRMKAEIDVIRLPELTGAGPKSQEFVVGGR